MRRFETCLLITLLLTPIALLALASDLAAPERSLSPRMLEIQEVLGREQTDLAKLQIELGSAPDEKEALRILRAIAQRKQDAEIAVLRVQKRFAQQEGDARAVADIDRAIERILDPQPAPLSPAEQEAREKQRAESARRDREVGHE
jgi:hypothetical protein